MVFACSPTPWSFKDAYQAKAIVYGKVIYTENDGRRATLDVYQYVGPGKAPKRIYLPETIDDRHLYPAGDSCPDFSMKFQTNEEYAIFLRDIPPNLQLLAPNYITAAHIDEGNLYINIQGEKDSIQNQLTQYADYKGYEIKQPTSYSPVWGGKYYVFWIVIATSVMAAITLGSLYLYKIYNTRKMNKNLHEKRE